MHSSAAAAAASPSDRWAEMEANRREENRNVWSKLNRKAVVNHEAVATASACSVLQSHEIPVTRVVRIKRQGGIVVQGCDVYIGRECTQGGWQLPKSKWHNPFSVTQYGSAAAAVTRFESYLMSSPELMTDIPELRGKVLGCWCKHNPSDVCHGDVLARLANQFSRDFNTEHPSAYASPAPSANIWSHLKRKAVDAGLPQQHASSAVVAKTESHASPASAAAAAASSSSPTTTAAVPHVPMSSKHRAKVVADILAHAHSGSTVKTAALAPLDDEQLAVLHVVVVLGESLFFSGEAGTGKSYLVKLMKELMDPDVTYFTAFTGLAAIPLGGTTFSSFCGFGLCNDEPGKLYQMARKRPKVVERWRNIRTLFVDECSMIDDRLFDTAEYFGRMFRDRTLPFGGIQVVLTGDFMQLPPVKGTKLLYNAKSWNAVVTHRLLLTKIYRQQEDPAWAELLSRLRMGELSIKDEAMLKKAQYTKFADSSIRPTTLFPLKHDAATFNETRMRELDTTSEVFLSEDKASDEGQMVTLDKECLAIARLELKVGAQVMLLKNISPKHGLCNGSLGVVTDFVTNYKTGVRAPKVQFLSGYKEVMEMSTWDVVVAGKVVASRRQFPLVLSSALTIHKCQGMTLERADITAAGMFEEHQLYVAVSRVKTLSGLRLRGFTRDCLRFNAASVAWYKQLALDTQGTVARLFANINTVPEKRSKYF